MMTNYEKYKDDIYLILEQWENVAFDKDMKKVVSCSSGFKCKNCLFSYQYNEYQYCNISRIEWLVSEYKESEVDWRNIPIDTPVLVSNDESFWYNRYFAGVDDEGKPFVFPDGRTSWSNTKCSRMWTSYKYIKLAEAE